MTIEERLKEKISRGHAVQLSSDITQGAVFLVALAAVIMAIVIGYKMTGEGGLSTNMLMAGGLTAALMAFAVFQTLHAAEAELKGKKLVLRKVIGPKYEVDVSRVVKMSSFNTQSTKYTLVRFQAEDGTEQKALIIGSNSLLFGRDHSAEDVIRLAQSVPVA